MDMEWAIYIVGESAFYSGIWCLAYILYYKILMAKNIKSTNHAKRVFFIGWCIISLIGFLFGLEVIEGIVVKAGILAIIFMGTVLALTRKKTKQ